MICRGGDVTAHALSEGDVDGLEVGAGTIGGQVGVQLDHVMDLVAVANATIEGGKATAFSLLNLDLGFGGG